MPDTQTAEDREAKRKAETLALFLALLLLTKKKMAASVMAFLLGEMHAEDLSQNLVTILTNAHAQATSLGRRLAGGNPLHETSNLHFAIAVMTTQIGPLARFVIDLRNGRYLLVDGELPKDAQTRILLYVLRVRGTANDAWRRTLDKATRYLWNLGFNVERHCNVCPEREAQSHVEPYTNETIPGLPGDFSTPCLGFCDCNVTTTDGETCFPYPEEL